MNSRRPFFIVLSMFMITVGCSQNSTTIYPSFENNCLKNDSCDTLFLKAQTSITLNVSEFRDSDLISLETKEGAWYFNYQNEDEIEISSRTLERLGESKPFESFEKSKYYVLELGKMQHGNPKSIFLHYAAIIKVE